MALTHPAVLALFVLSLTSAGVTATDFRIYDSETGVLCAELNGTFTVNFFLLDGTEVVDQVEIDQDYPDVYLGGNCDTVFALIFGDKRVVSWEFDVVVKNHSASNITLTPYVQFQPYYVFGTEDPEYDTVLFQDFVDNPILPDITSSYACSKPITHNYTRTFDGGYGDNFNYAVSVTVAEIQIQTGNMPDGQFGPPVLC